MSNVSTTRHISTSCCQSRLLRGERPPGGHSSNLAQAHLRNHALEAGAEGSARGLNTQGPRRLPRLATSQVAGDDRDGVLQPLALAIVLHSMN